jgi:hypothetical protein
VMAAEQDQEAGFQEQDPRQEDWNSDETEGS